MKKLLVITFLALATSLSAFPNLKELGFPFAPGTSNAYAFESAEKMQFTRSEKGSFHHHHNDQIGKSIGILMDRDMMNSKALIFDTESDLPAEFCTSVTYYSNDVFIYRFGTEGIIVAYFFDEGRLCYYSMLFFD